MNSLATTTLDPSFLRAIVLITNFKPNPTQNGDTWNVYEWKLTP